MDTEAVELLLLASPPVAGHLSTCPPRSVRVIFTLLSDGTCKAHRYAAPTRGQIFCLREFLLWISARNDNHRR